MKAKILAFITESDARIEKMEAEFRDSREKLLRDLRELQNQQSEQKSRLEQITKTDLSLMIRRIMEMTGSIQKQDQEIRKVIVENLGGSARTEVVDSDAASYIQYDRGILIQGMRSFWSGFIAIN
ncbi:hypothetical protein ANCCAN_01228 [Ancylostoma caninum]|uniref:Uncharacterized protein n=1 Tax=Ancylostoma caninum TaxID=29170 RepID=A0A368HAZ3_ANCCA|nr:hypothetical protein ANCCAN_01228 [Ancylostoma caninum]